MSTKHRTHLIRAEATNVTTWCGKVSEGGGVGRFVKHFHAAPTAGAMRHTEGEFYAAKDGCLADCKLCLAAVERSK